MSFLGYCIYADNIWSLQNMKWQKLLSKKRFNASGDTSDKDATRSPWLVDLDRVTFSSAFRRLQGKTQVHPLDQHAQVRTRLTHSFEVASVGRSLGYRIGQYIVPKYKLKKNGISADDFGYIVQVACLAHDIGNPPFGHAGEDAIGYFFRANADWIFDDNVSPEIRNNLENFEGNAQGFRILNNSTSWREQGGLRLTYSTLGTFCKYPRQAILDKKYKIGTWMGDRKCGIYDSEKHIWNEVTDELGLVKRYNHIDLWARHPFAFLVEAADDICYSVIDLEDGVNVGAISFAEAEKLLVPIARHPAKYGKTKRLQNLQGEGWYKRMTIAEKLDFLRGKAIGNLIDEVVHIFTKNEAQILAGEFNNELLSETIFGKDVTAAKNYAYRNVFLSPQKLEVEIAASDILGGLLNAFCRAFVDISANNKQNAAPKSAQLLKIIDHPLNGLENRETALLQICDFISGMTDQHAVNLYRKISGISI